MTILLLFTASGATCHHNAFTPQPTAPVAFTAPPTLEQIIYSVNATTDRVRSLHTDTATLSLAGLPAGLRASMTLERPRRFRLKARLLGPELDLGSNDEHFWFWSKINPQPVVLYASHEAYSRSAARQVIPIEPQWLIEALGLVRMEPNGVHEGPYTAGPNRVEVRSSVPTARGPMARILLIDATYGWIVEQRLVDPQGQVVATSRMSNHRYDTTTGVSLPHRVDIEVPGEQLALTLIVSDYTVNQLPQDPLQLWSMPQFEGYTPVDIADPRFQLIQQPAPQVTPMYPPRAAYRPTFRGYER